VATYKDIQTRTGLSLATISKHFNGKPIREANRIAIEAAVLELDYRVNAMASNLRSGRTRTVGVLLPSLENGFHMSIVARVERVLRTHGVSVIVSSTEEESPDSTALDSLLRRQVDALLTVPGHEAEKALAAVAAQRVPVVCLDWDPDRPELDLVTIDNEAAGRLAARHLHDHGHHRIALIGGDDSIPTARDRRRGFVTTLREVGAPVDDQFLMAGPLTVEHGRSAMHALLALDMRPTAVFTTNAELTIGAVIALNESSLRLGADVSIIGFDSSDIAKVTQPRLTVIAQPVDQIAAAVADLVLSRLHSTAGQPQHRRFSAELAIGASVADIKTSGPPGATHRTP